MKIMQSFKSAALTGMAGAVLLGSSALGQVFTFSVESVALDSPDNVAFVYARLSEEAWEYCQGLEAFGTASPSAVAACHQDVVETVVERIDDDALSDYHARAHDRPAGASSIASL